MALKTYSDSDALTGAYIAFSNPEPNGDKLRVKLQFAPKVTADNRRGNWDEREIRGVEPLAIYRGSSSRNITLQLTYINDGDQWNCSTIREQVNLIRGYFMRAAGPSLQQDILIVYLRLWCIGGESIMTFRMRSCDVKYSETMVTDTNVNFFQNGSYQYYPLRTDITIDLASWAKKLEVGFAKELNGGPAVPNIPDLPRQNQEPKADSPIQDVKNLIPQMPQDWY